MKKILYSFFAVLFAAAILISCNKEVNNNAEPDNGLIHVTINAGNPRPSLDTKTEMVGTTPYWSVGDIIGVSNGTDSNVQFTTDIGSASTNASFTGTVASVGDYYAYYPHTSNGVGSSGGSTKGAKVDLPANQYPTVSSFDGSADIMVSKRFTVTETTPTVDDLEFARLGAIVKIVLNDTESLLGGQHPTTVSMTAESNLVGRVLVNMQDQCMEDPYFNQSMTVTANYTSLTKYEIDGTNATYLIVVPQTLAAGTSLTIAASTEAFAIEKVIPVPVGGIDLQAGKITTLNVSLTSAHITADTGLALPFNDNFSWQTGTSTSAVTFDSDPAIPSAKYSAQEKVYQGSAAGVIKFGTASVIGYLTTVELDLSSAFYVHINAKNYSTACTMSISVDDGVPQTVDLTGSYADYYFNFAAATTKSKVKIATTSPGYRSFVQQFDIISGTYVFPPVINVTSSNPLAVANTASSQTITYTIANPTGESLSAALQNPSDTWISNINCTAGEVTFDVAAQAASAPARSAVIVLSYTGADDVEVTVNQAAGSGGASTSTLTFTSACGGSGTADDGAVWTVTSDASESTFDSTHGIHYGTNSANVQYVQLSTSDITGTISQVVVTTRDARATATVSVSVGGSPFTCSSSTTATNSSVPYTFTGSGTGEIVVRVDRGSANTKAIYVKSIVVTYTN